MAKAFDCIFLGSICLLSMIGGEFMLCKEKVTCVDFNCLPESLFVNHG